MVAFTWARHGGYEVSTQGDRRFSALVATMPDGRTIEMHYQCDVKGYQPGGTNWRLGKGKKPLLETDLWSAYLALWRTWAKENGGLLDELAKAACSERLLSDRFATSPVNQARALAEILNERPQMTTKFFDLMCDVECMGKGENAALVSLGCVFFDLKTQTMGPTFLRTINLATAVRDGGTMDASTMDASTVTWWMRQGDEARHSIAYNGQDIRKVLTDFSDWIKETCRHEDVRPHGNSDSFDIPKIETAMARIGLPAPWHFTNVRCFRTMRAMYPQVEYNPAEKGTGAHNALADAEFQVRHLWKIVNRNKKAPA